MGGFGNMPDAQKGGIRAYSIRNQVVRFPDAMEKRGMYPECFNGNEKTLQSHACNKINRSVNQAKNSEKPRQRN